MTLDIEKLEELAKAATRGKWVADGDVLRSAKDDLTIVSIGKVWLPKDSQFIAAAREAVPALIARVRELEAALKPFADEAFTYEPDEDDSWQRVWDSKLTLGDLRNARRTLKGSET